VRHVVVTRFSVPRLDEASARRHAEPSWLDERLAYFREYYVPGVERCGVPAVLLCSTQSAAYVGDRLGDLGWVSVVVQDSWHGGWRGAADQMVTRLDSDDAVCETWFERLDRAGGAGSGEAGAGAGEIEVYCTRSVLRLDARRGKLYAITRREPSPLAAFARGANPFAHDHKHLEKHYRVRCFREPYLLQVVHGGNLSSRAPAWWRFRRRLPLARLTAFGLDPGGSGPPPDAGIRYD
jgi:hypothetical protein